MMKLEELEQVLKVAIDKSLIPVSSLISKCKVISTPGLADPSYLSFYYHFGKHIQPKTILDLDFDLGLKEVCFLKSCKSVSMIGGLSSNKEYNDLAIKYASDNIKSVYLGKVEIYERFSTIVGTWDLILCDDPQFAKDHIQDIWSLMNHDGLLVVDNIYRGENEFGSVASIVNRVPIYIENRYKLGIIQR